jgi:4-hydroxyacetophenone monooxygenase
MLDAGYTVAECRPDVYDAYNRALDEAHDRMIWTYPGLTTWYRNDKGRVVTNMPWRVVDYWAMTRAADLANYVLRAPTSGSPI